MEKLAAQAAVRQISLNALLDRLQRSVPTWAWIRNASTSQANLFRGPTGAKAIPGVIDSGGYDLEECFNRNSASTPAEPPRISGETVFSIE